MEVRAVENEKEWEHFMSAVSFAPFAQSYAWGEFQASLGKKVLRLFIGKQAAFQFIFERRPFVGGYWFAPKGPVFATRPAHRGPAARGDSRNAKQVLETLKMYAETHLREGVFLRIEPMIERGDVQVPKEWERKKSLNPSSTRRLDLGKNENDLLKDMHQKTRYNIRLSEKKNVLVRDGGANDLDAFLELMKQTAERGQFLQHDDTYLRKTYAFLAAHNMAKLRFVEHEGSIIAGQMEIWYGDTVTYLYGASGSEHRELMAPFALHWTAITEAKRQGKKWYDFWGENPDDEASVDYKPSWSGISRFKKGFGGEHVEYIGTYDAPIRKPTYAFLRTLRRI